MHSMLVCTVAPVPEARLLCVRAAVPCCVPKMCQEGRTWLVFFPSEITKRAAGASGGGESVSQVVGMVSCYSSVFELVELCVNCAALGVPFTLVAVPVSAGPRLGVETDGNS